MTSTGKQYKVELHYSEEKGRPIIFFVAIEVLYIYIYTYT